jgi:hypothetical protein
MCDGNNECEYEGAMLEATGGSEILLYCSANDRDYHIPSQVSVEVCPECGEPNWRTFM